MLSRKRFILKWISEPVLFIIILTVLLVWIWIVLSFQYKTSLRGIGFNEIKKNSILQKHQKQDAPVTFQYMDFVSGKILRRSEVTKGFEFDPQCMHLSKCFDFSKCNNGFSVYVYPLAKGEMISPMYSRILDVLQSSIYFTDDPSEACLSILSLDTHDRDVISSNFVKQMDTKLKKLKHWNNGQNHLVIVFFSGTWPNYLETVSFRIGKAMIARASSSLKSIRRGFDVSIPLVPKDFPIVSTNLKLKSNRIFPLQRKYLLSFKGKRYLYGIGSESRNALYLIRNKKFVLLTTCRHNTNWEKYKDDRCDADNEDYDRYDYNELLRNSTFCLIPRGRRLGSFRFLESMKYGCIPVLLSNGWDLPYKDLIDWSKFSLNIDERNLLQLPSIIEGISEQVILSMRQQTLFIYKTYFSSVTSIFNMMLEEVRERIFPHLKRSYNIWNKAPGALNVDSSYSTTLSLLPFYNTPTTKAMQKFTAIILAVSTVQRSTPLYRLIQTINLSDYVDQILVIWLSKSSVPTKNKWPKTKVSLRVVHPPKRSLNSRYINMKLMRTDAIFSFDEDVVVNTAEIDFAFSVWLSNPDRLIGFTTTSHFLDNSNQSEPRWTYTTRHMNTYSMIDTSAAVFHRYYSHHYSTRLPNFLLEMVSKEETCESLVMNFLVSSLTQKSPIKVTTSSHFKPANPYKEHMGVTFTPETHLKTMQQCFNALVKAFGGEPPLVWSKIAMNPVLYKDPVSIIRKKFKKLEV